MKEISFNLFSTNTSAIQHNCLCSLFPLHTQLVFMFVGNGVCTWIVFRQQQVRVDLVFCNAVNIIIISIAVVSARFGVDFSVRVDFCSPFDEFFTWTNSIFHIYLNFFDRFSNHNLNFLVQMRKFQWILNEKLKLCNFLLSLFYAVHHCCTS